MERSKFIRTCCYSAISIPLGGALLQSCGAIYFATSTREAGKLVVARSEFVKVNRNNQTSRNFVLLKTADLGFPICLYKTDENGYTASLLKCTHKGCELNVGGGVYSCPCHGSEFSVAGKVLEGPADRDLQTFKIETDREYIYIYLA